MPKMELGSFTVNPNPKKVIIGKVVKGKCKSSKLISQS